MTPLGLAVGLACATTTPPSIPPVDTETTNVMNAVLYCTQSIGISADAQLALQEVLEARGIEFVASRAFLAQGEIESRFAGLSGRERIEMQQNLIQCMHEYSGRESPVSEQRNSETSSTQSALERNLEAIGLSIGFPVEHNSVSITVCPASFTFEPNAQLPRMHYQCTLYNDSHTIQTCSLTVACIEIGSNGEVHTRNSETRRTSIGYEPQQIPLFQESMFCYAQPQAQLRIATALTCSR